MKRFTLAGLVLCALVAAAAAVRAQAPATTGDAAVAALIAEVRALRADMAAASRNQLRAQMLLGRVQMQEQRIAYLDKQRADVVAAASVQQQMTAQMRSTFGLSNNPCAGIPATQAEQKRDCEANAGAMRKQLEAFDAREQELRTQENDLANALAAEQARWTDFNSRLDELERSLR